MIPLFSLGFYGWTNTEAWNAKMPSITFICFIILVVLTFFAFTKNVILQNLMNLNLINIS